MKTIVLLRHADIDEPHGPEPILNAAGVERAKALAHVLGTAGVTTVFVSPALRTQQTARPLLDKLGISFQIPSDSEIIEKALAAETGDVVVIIGHSNTVPKLISDLGAPFSATAILQGHEDLFVVTVVASGNASVLRLKYGNSMPTSD